MGKAVYERAHAHVANAASACGDIRWAAFRLGAESAGATAETTIADCVRFNYTLHDY